MAGRRTWRMVDGERVEGVTRPVVLHNFNYFLSEITIYADGLIDCWGLCSFAEFRAQVASGRVASTIPDDAVVSQHLLGSFKVRDAKLLAPELLIAEVADEIERLAGRPTSSDTCQAALDALLSDPSNEQRRAELRAAYFDVPEHLRAYLGDMDTQDSLIRTLMTPVGGVGRDVPVTADQHRDALEYLRAERASAARYREVVQRRGDPSPADPASYVPQAVYPKGWPSQPGIETLQLEYPCQISVGELRYPSVAHAFWATAVVDEAVRAAIAAEPNAYLATRMAREAKLRSDWADVQLAVMARLLRHKYQTRPDLARLLIATGNGPIIYQGMHDDPRIWRGNAGKEGGAPVRNWVGRLLELIRSELVAAGLV